MVRRDRRRTGAAGAYAAMLLAWHVALAGSETDAPYEMERYVMAAGGAFSSSADGIELSATIGQPCAGVLDGGEIALAAGLWDPFLFGDFDGDGDSDLEDYAQLEPCILGPGDPVPPSCRAADLDGSGTVDLEDFRLAQNSFTGSSND